MASQWDRDNQRANWEGMADKETQRGRTDKAAQYHRKIEQSLAAEPQYTVRGSSGGGGAPSGGGCGSALLIGMLSLPTIGAVASYYS